eukprot:SAG31_NODE_1012_length_10379_cov_3.699319_6_plen_185_part_00
MGDCQIEHAVHRNADFCNLFIKLHCLQCVLGLMVPMMVAVLTMVLTARAGQPPGGLGPPAEKCPLPGTKCRPDGPWPLTQCKLLENETSCVTAKCTPVCNSDGCGTYRRCTWNATSSICAEPPPPPPPQQCSEITKPIDCVWSLGRDCRWAHGECTAVPPATEIPLPPCAADHTCAHNGLSDTP